MIIIGMSLYLSFIQGDFDQTDMDAWEARYPERTKGTLQLINLLGTPYWQTPAHLNEADLPTWSESRI
jgi:hypothetical protein